MAGRRDYRGMVTAIKNKLDSSKREQMERLREVRDNGADAGFSGFTYYTDTGKFYAKWKEVIWQLLAEDAENSGDDVLTMIAGFGGAKNVSDDVGFENLLAWYALEAVANREVGNE
jgi:hypothetical protein